VPQRLQEQICKSFIHVPSVWEELPGRS
jgi:hypothetical protein